MLKRQMLEADKPIKFDLTCEVCGFETLNLKVIKHFLYCKECAQAKKRRDRFIETEKEWNEHKG